MALPCGGDSLVRGEGACGVVVGRGLGLRGRGPRSVYRDCRRWVKAASGSQGCKTPDMVDIKDATECKVAHRYLAQWPHCLLSPVRK